MKRNSRYGTVSVPFFLFDLIAFSKLNFEVDIAYAKYNNKAINSNKKLLLRVNAWTF